MTVSVRYHWYSHKKVVVVNDLTDKKWHKEEKPAGFPFDSGYLTTVRIAVDNATQTYKIFANGEHFYDFKFRNEGTPDQVKYLAVIRESARGPPAEVVQLLVSLFMHVYATSRH